MQLKDEIPAEVIRKIVGHLDCHEDVYQAYTVSTFWKKSIEPQLLKRQIMEFIPEKGRAVLEIKKGFIGALSKLYDHSPIQTYHFLQDSLVQPATSEKKDWLIFGLRQCFGFSGHIRPSFFRNLTQTHRLDIQYNALIFLIGLKLSLEKEEVKSLEPLFHYFRNFLRFDVDSRVLMFKTGEGDFQPLDRLIDQISSTLDSVSETAICKTNYTSVNAESEAEYLVFNSERPAPELSQGHWYCQIL